ncbi:MAG: response regulator [Patescibacteria group bacterium]|nr:response regulator [Patescibacteria group bacterium]
MDKIKKIAVVEDEAAIMDIYKIKLKLSGYQVVTAENGDVAIKIIKKEKPDLVLLDILLPKKDGFEVLDEIRKSEDEKIKSTPVIITSNLSNEEDIQEAKNIGIVDYVIKAKSTPLEIIKKIDKFFNKK